MSVPKQSLRPLRIVGEFAYVPLSQGREAKIDVQDVPLVQGFNWSADVKKKNTYAMRGIKLGGGKSRVVYMHRIIMGVEGKVLVDHIDGDGLNNCRSNLRIANHSQNLSNRGKPANNTSGFKGVVRACGRWKAQITKKGKNFHLGLFDDPREAHAAYIKAAEEIHGEFARAA